MPQKASNNIICIPLKATNVYLIPCQDGYLQVDTGYQRDYPAYRKGLIKASIIPSDIKYLFLTHHHDDHAGFLNDLTRDISLTVIANHFAKDLLVGGKNDTSRGGGYVSRTIKILVRIMMRLDPLWNFTFPPFTLRSRDILLDGDNCEILRKIGLAGDILYTPGHCIDHQSLLFDNGDLISGDAAFNMLLFAGTHYCTMFMTNMEEAYKSWQKLLDAGSRTVYPSHGGPFPASRLRENIGKIRTQDLLPL